MAAPGLDDALLRRVAAAHPLPIADAAVFVRARSDPHARLLAGLDVFRAALRTVASCALAARLQFGAGPTEPAGDVGELTEALSRRGLTEGQWVHLTRAILRGWSGEGQRHPLPALVALFESRRFEDAIEKLLGVRNRIAHRTASLDEEVAALLSVLGPALATLLEALDPLWSSCHLAAAHDATRAIDLMGSTPPRGMWHRRDVAPGVELVAGEVVVLDRDGKALLSLEPVVRLLEPAPGEVAELFFLDGRKRRSASMLALPSGALRDAPGVWETVERLLSAEGGDAEGAAAGERPFRGLRSFGPEDAALFFGREELTEQLANRIRARAMLTLTGPSGVGKSSLLAAGVIPALRRFAEHQRDLGLAPYRAPIGELSVVTIRPGAEPLAALRRALGETIDAAPDDIAPETADALVRAWAGDTRSLLVVVDQAEELFTLGSDPAARDAFAAVLARLAADDHGPSRVVLSVRGDFFHRLAELAPLADLYERNARVLTVPDRDTLLRILREPVARFDYRFEDGLAERMVAAVESEPAALALLSFCADRLWDARDRAWKRLTLEAYEGLGGVAGALAGHADALVDAMPESHAEVARQLLLRLVTADGTRAVLSRRELIEGSARPDSAAHVLAALTEGRLLSAREAEGGEGTIELAHEALITHWSRLHAWREEDRESQRHLAELREAARRWEARGRSPDALLRGELLTAHRAWRRRTDAPLTRLEREFADASEHAARRARRTRLAALLGALAALGAAAAISLAGWLDAAAERDRAESERRSADVRALLAQAGRHASEGHPAEAVAVLRAAIGAARGERERRDVLRSGLLPLQDRPLPLVLPAPMRGRIDGGVSALEHSPDGRILAIGAFDGTTRLYDVRTGALLQTLRRHSQHVVAIAFSRDGRWLATGSSDGRAMIWDRRTGRHLRTMRGGSEIALVGFSPDGERFVTVTKEGRARLFEAATGRQIRALENDPVERSPHRVGLRGVSFPDRRHVVAVTGLEEGIVSVWNAETGAHLRTLEVRQPFALSENGRWLVSVQAAERELLTSRPPRLIVTDLVRGEVRQSFQWSDEIGAVAISPDGSMLATGQQGFVVLWDVASGERRPELRLEDPVHELAFSANGRVLAAHSGERTRVADAAAGRWLRTFQEPGGEAVREWSLSRDGSRLVTVGLYAFVVHVWSTRGSERVMELAPAPPLSSGWIRFPGGRTVATFSDHGALLFDARSGRPRGRLDPGAGFGAQVHLAVSSDRVVLMHARRSLRAGDVRAGSELRPLEEAPWTDGSTLPPFDDATISDSGSRVAASVEDRGIRIWDAQSGERLRDIRDDDADTVVLSPDGRIVAAAGDAPEVRLFDVDSGRRVRALPGDDTLWWIAFSPDGSRIATVGNTVRFFDTASGELLWSRERNGERLVFSGDGRVLAVSGETEAHLLDVADGAVLRTLRGHEHPIHALAFTPDGGRVVTGSVDGTARVWDAATGAVLQIVDLEAPVQDVAVAPGGDLLAAITHTGAWVLPLRTADLAPFVRETAARSNLRVCRESYEVVPVALGPDVDPVWADAAACARAHR